MKDGLMLRLPASLFLRSAFLALFSLLSLLPAQAQGVRFDRATLAVVSPSGRHVTFSVELAIDDSQRMLGLMHRQSMPADHGMLFDFGQAREVVMWMKNTVLPLDMLFIDEGGSVRHVREHAVPFSEDLISSNGNIRYVLELNAGTVRELGIGVGSHVDVKTLKRRG